VDTIPYERKFGRSIQKAVADLSERSLSPPEECKRKKSIGFLARIGLRRAGFFSRMFSTGPSEGKHKPLVRALGPIGHIYFGKDVDPAARESFAEALLTSAHVPMVVLPNVDRDIEVWTNHGKFDLPREAQKVLDSESPYFEEMTDDLITACRQPNAGDLIIYGGERNLDEYYTFATESGSHGGITRGETEGFALVPGATALVAPDKGYARPMDLRNCALELLGKKDTDRREGPVRPLQSKGRLRIMTYNVHGCVGMDGRLSPRRIANVISQYEPDVIALQELDVGRYRSGGHDQAMLIAEILNMDHHFQAAMQIAEERFGDAILSTYPMRLVKKDILTREARFSSLEPRGAIWVEIDFDGTLTHIINTHLGLHPTERMIHARELLGQDWLRHPQCQGPAVLCGDFNTLPRSRLLNLMRVSLTNAGDTAGATRSRSTWCGRLPFACIDYIFVRPDLEVAQMEVGDSYLARLASDHRPVLAEIDLPERQWP
jgi:endonuclease/exonuclease/phosphatase family metal-dependent hydrolase